MKRLHKRLVVLISMVVAGGLLLELVPAPAVERKWMEPLWVESDVLRHHIPVPGSRQRVVHPTRHTVHDIHFDDLGLPVDPERPRRAGRPLIAVVGDSFVANTALPAAQRPDARLQFWLGKSGVEADVVNCGVRGTGPGLQWQLLEQLIPARRPTDVLWVHYLNDLDDIARYGVLRDVNGDLTSDVLFATGKGGFSRWLNDRPWARRLALGRTSEKGDAAASFREVVRRVRDLCGANGVRLHCVHAVDRRHIRMDTREALRPHLDTVAAIHRQLQTAYVDPAELEGVLPLRSYHFLSDLDGHWSAAGADRQAQLWARSLAPVLPGFSALSELVDNGPDPETLPWYHSGEPESLNHLEAHLALNTVGDLQALLFREGVTVRSVAFSPDGRGIRRATLEIGPSTASTLQETLTAELGADSWQLEPVSKRSALEESFDHFGDMSPYSGAYVLRGPGKFNARVLARHDATTTLVSLALVDPGEGRRPDTDRSAELALMLPEGWRVACRRGSSEFWLITEEPIDLEEDGERLESLQQEAEILHLVTGRIFTAGAERDLKMLTIRKEVSGVQYHDWLHWTH